MQLSWFLKRVRLGFSAVASLIVILHAAIGGSSRSRSIGEKAVVYIIDRKEQGRESKKASRGVSKNGKAWATTAMNSDGEEGDIQAR